MSLYRYRGADHREAKHGSADADARADVGADHRSADVGADHRGADHRQDGRCGAGSVPE